MEDAELLVRLRQINLTYQACIQELQSHRYDINPFLFLEIERFVLVKMLFREIADLREQVATIRQSRAWED